MLVGGAIQSTTAEGYLAETGPNSILLKDKRVAQLLSDIGLCEKGSLNHELLPAREAAKKRYIVKDGSPHAIPTNLSGILKTPLFSLKGKLRVLAEPFIGKYQGSDGESFASFVRRRFGSELLDSAAAPFVSGIYAGDPEQLSISQAFPRMADLEEQYGSILKGFLTMQLGRHENPNKYKPTTVLSFRSGMHVLPQAIADSLPQESIYQETKIQKIEKTNHGWFLTWRTHSGVVQTGMYQNLVLAVPHHCLAQLPLPASVLDEITPVINIKAPPVTSLVLGFRKKDVAHALDGFGMLIRKQENSPLLGVLFSSSMFEHRAPDNHITLTCMMGGSIHPEYAENDDLTVLAELKRLLGVTGEPTFRHRTAWQNAIPQYDMEYQHALASIASCEAKHSGLHLAANYRGGIAVGDCIINGLELGELLSQTLS